MNKLVFVAGAAVGYILGARAGRQRYEQLLATAQKIRENPTLQNATDVLQGQAEQVADAAKSKLRNSSIGNKLIGPGSDEASNTPEYWETAGSTTPGPSNHASTTS
ncbi:MAG TPA: hypothetical protein H9902_07785 [Candidatus Stackebrandtia faecavium]|nr:hypothetical protein [Candidatus Stackebrandtia faecavium]